MYTITLWYVTLLHGTRMDRTQRCGQGVCGFIAVPHRLFLLADGQGFRGQHCSFDGLLLTDRAWQSVPALLKGKTESEMIKTFLQPPVGALVAAIVSTYGWLLRVSCCRMTLTTSSQASTSLRPSSTATPGTCSRVLSSTSFLRPVSRTCSMSTRSATCTM
jgi:hypothetical protein